MAFDERELDDADATVPPARQFVTCIECGWVHYVMTDGEKAANDRFADRYDLDDDERFTYESAFRMCLQCEAPVSEFREASARDLQRAEGHLVTPLLVKPDELHRPVH